MADGHDAGRRLLQECGPCQALDQIPHQCAFLTESFDAQNWNCASLRLLWTHAVVTASDEVAVATLPCPDGSVVVLMARVGQSQRIRAAQVVTPLVQVVPLTRSQVDALRTER